MSRPLLFRAGLALLGAGLLAGVVQLFALRFHTGQGYPAYSSLRSDPLGCKAFAEALAALPQVSVKRGYRPPVAGSPRAAYFYAGVTKSYIPSLAHRIAEGSRATFTLLPVPAKQRPVKRNSTTPAPRPAATPEPAPATKGRARAKTKPKSGSPEQREEEAQEREPPAPALEMAWGFEVGIRNQKEAGAFVGRARLTANAPELERELPWHSAAYFASLAPAWRAIYTCDGRPVVIERAWGEGSIVVASDSYFLSNEALYSSDRASKFLAWLIGPHKLVSFDEEHHGLGEDPGVASLIRKYRLQGVLLGLTLLVALFVWQQAAAFPPVLLMGSSEAPPMTGRSSAEGLVNLLRRALPPARVLETCVAEWRRSAPASGPENTRLAAAWAALQASPVQGRNLPAAYRALTAALHPE